jgi:hypothetical protein
MYTLATKSLQFGIPFRKSLAIAMQESQFRNDAVSDQGAVSHMQIKPETAADYCFGKKYKSAGKAPVSEIKNNASACGLTILRQSMAEFPSYASMGYPAMYNGGNERFNKVVVKQNKFDDLPKETREYTKKVLGFEKNYGRSTPVIKVDGNTFTLYEEDLHYKPSRKLPKGRIQLKTRTEDQWGADPKILAYNLTPLGDYDSNLSKYYLHPTAAKSFKLANQEYKKVFKEDIRLISAFRDPSHNKKEGGVDGSHHRQGVSIDVDFYYISKHSRDAKTAKAKIELMNALLMRHGFEPLSGVSYKKFGVWQGEDNHFDYVSLKKIKPITPYTELNKSNFSDVEFRRLQWMLDVAYLQGNNYIDMYIN